MADAALTGVIGPDRWRQYLRYQDQRIEDDIPGGHVACHLVTTVMIAAAGGLASMMEKRYGRKNLCLTDV